MTEKGREKANVSTTCNCENVLNYDFEWAFLVPSFFNRSMWLTMFEHSFLLRHEAATYMNNVFFLTHSGNLN